MTDARAWDALFVVHRQTPWEPIAHACLRLRCTRVLLLTTHQFFPAEIGDLRRLIAPTEPAFLSFAELFDDPSLADIDDHTSRELLGARVPPGHFATRYEERCMHLKNAAARDRLLSTAAFQRIFVHDGLGITSAPWTERGAEKLGTPTHVAQSPASRMLRALHRLASRNSPTLSLVEHGSSHYIFHGNLRRLRLKSTVARPITRRQAKLLDHALAAVALHEYSPAVHDLGSPVRVFVDSFLPSNYPRSYIDAYANVEFVCPDPFSAAWVKKYGYVARPTPDFIAIEPFRRPPAPNRVHTFVLLLNHAGDWCALINRSDTDQIIAHYIELAGSRPDLEFIVRPHPGMDNPRHEGACARARVEDIIARCGLSNISCSKATIEQDFARGDFFLSEYSASLIEAWQRGKLGMAVNVTRRRSFMADFSEIGFACAPNPNAMKALTCAAVDNPEEFATQQAVAVDRYNRLLEDHLAQ